MPFVENGAETLDIILVLLKFFHFFHYQVYITSKSFSNFSIILLIKIAKDKNSRDFWNDIYMDFFSDILFSLQPSQAK